MNGALRPAPAGVAASGLARNAVQPEKMPFEEGQSGSRRNFRRRPLSREARWRVYVGEQAVRDVLGGGLHRVRGKVGVAGGRLRMTVAEESANHGQAVAPG